MSILPSAAENRLIVDSGKSIVKLGFSLMTIDLNVSAIKVIAKTRIMFLQIVLDFYWLELVLVLS